MMPRVYLSSPAVGYLCLLLWDIQPMAAMEMSGGATVSRHPPVVTATRGGSVVLPCLLPRGWIDRNYGVQWYRTPGPAGARDEPRGRGGEAAAISSPALPPRFSLAEHAASLRIAPVAAEDAGVYSCVAKTLGQSPYRGNGTELRVLAPPSVPHLFLQVPSDLWSGQWNLFCVTGGFHPNQVRLSWTQNGAESELQDCTPGSADPGPVQTNGSVRQNLTLEENDDSAPKVWLPVSLVMEVKPRPHQQCIFVTDSSGRGPYLVSVLPLSLGPAAGVTYTCTVRDHPALPTALSASLNWEPPSGDAIRCLNVIKICLLAGVALGFAVAALNWLFKKREPCHL
ncbi:signal-regulatory protein beta-1-like [Anguilla anguilla]|uniref:signal-regulatory protein beta-1-like n=1 Tax=Anguilla anguilla TaxID=7936 RepID=UPI0015B25DB0|nr:signal-regulatory protein beta-1-like [Anguilla anguilla]